MYNRPDYTPELILGDIFYVTLFTSHRASLFHGMTSSTHPVGSIFAEAWNVACPDFLPVTLLAIAFIVLLVCPMRKGDSVFEFENFRAIVCKRGYCYEKNCRD